MFLVGCFCKVHISSRLCFYFLRIVCFWCVLFRSKICQFSFLFIILQPNKNFKCNEKNNSKDCNGIAVALYIFYNGGTSANGSYGGQYNDPSDEIGPPHRMPASPIYVYQDGHTFTFDSSLAGEVVEVLSGETLLYTAVVGVDGNVVLPDDISGEVEIRLVRSRMTYYATVEL